MATESPIRMLETSGKWPAPRKAAKYGTSANKTAEELILLQKGHNYGGNGGNSVPGRSGSAPPNMEGSFSAIGNHIYLNSGLSMSMANLNGAMRNYEAQEQLRDDPTYLTDLLSHVSRLPKHHIHHTGRSENNCESTSFRFNANKSLYSSEIDNSITKKESEEERFPQDPFGKFSSGQDAVSSSGQNKMSVATTQEEKYSNSLTVYNKSHTSSTGMTKKACAHDPESGFFSSSNEVTSTNTAVASKVNTSAAYILSSLTHDSTGDIPSTPPVQEGALNDKNVWLENVKLSHTVNSSDVANITARMKDLQMSTPNPGNQENQHELHQEQGKPSEVQSVKPEIRSQGVISPYMAMDPFHQRLSNSSTAVQPVLQSSGFTPPLYATAAAAYMTSPNLFYPTMQTSGYYSSQYGVGGYTVNSSVIPPLIAGYPPHGPIPVLFDGSVSPNPNAIPGVPGSILHGVEMQHYNKFYGQAGFALQPSFVNPFHVQQYQQPLVDAYSTAGQLDPLASRSGSQSSVHGLQKWPEIAASSVQKLEHQRLGPSNSNQIKAGINAHYLGNPADIGILMHYSSSPLSSPNLPRGTEKRFPSDGSRNSVGYSSWRGQNGLQTYSELKMYNVLEELKSGKSRRFELSDIAGHIVEFSADQHGSRFIQQKLENCSNEEKASVFGEVLPYSFTLMTDVFGNYVIQKFFEYGSPEQRKELANRLAGQILPLSLQMYGCRVIQKALEVIDIEQRAKLVHELDGHVLRCVRDQNGNHVIQKCIESIPTEKIGFIISAFRGQVATLSMHPYGCRVIQRILERCTDERQCQFMVDEILDSVCSLAQDQYGNYVTQHVLERGKHHERSKIVSKLSGHLVQLSQHKFASNVIEKCLEYGGTADREFIIEEIAGQQEGNDNLLTMMKDQYANYVIQRIFETCTDSQRVLLLSRIRVHAHALKKYTYGKHIVARFEQLFGEENQSTSS